MNQIEIVKDWNKLPFRDLFEEEIQQQAVDSGYINLRNLQVSSLSIPSRFTIKSLHLCEKNYKTEIKTFLQELKLSNGILTAVFEALINAFEHGNNYDSSKGLYFAYFFNNKYLEFIICDSGGVLNLLFPSFILAIRSNKNQSLNWYDFSKVEQKRENLGFGTMFMHQYMQDIKYFKSAYEDTQGGLFLYMRAKK